MSELHEQHLRLHCALPERGPPDAPGWFRPHCLGRLTTYPLGWVRTTPPGLVVAPTPGSCSRRVRVLRRCMMLEPVVGLVPLDDLMAGVRANVLAEPEPAGETLERLLQTVERHAELEADALDQYEYLGKASDDAVITLVMRLILDDEVRHHGLLKRL